MNKLFAFGAMAAALAVPANAQSAQDKLDARYDRALAAGYKALFLCSAIANAEANGVKRTPESVHEWELSGIYPKLDPIIRDMPYEIVRRPTGQIAHAQVKWTDDAPDRVAEYFGPEAGCSILPIGAPENISNPQAPVPLPETGKEPESPLDGLKLEAELKDGSNLDDLFDTPLNSVLAAAFDGKSYGEGRTTAALVRVVDQDGDLKSETAKYALGFDENTPQRTWSVAKSIASTLVGMAVHSREYAVDDPVGLNYWTRGGAADPRNTITIDHALRMATGRYSDTPGNRTDPIYWGGGTVDEYMTNWPVVRAPGTVYRYANNDTLLAAKAIGQYLYFYTPAELIAKFDMKGTVIETDWKGGYVLSSQVWATAPDLANLGQLYLNNGAWGGERLLPENWREYVSNPSGPQPEGTQWGYGAGWWTFRRPEGNAFDGIPDDAFAARGNRGQYVVVVPSRDVVIVRRGEDMVGTRFDIAAFTKDVLAALED